MCLLDYDFMILDNAFLIHKPGIKRKKHELELSRPKYAIRRQNRMLKKTQAEITEKYGKREGCYHLY
jgi:N-acetyllactosaminide beta-1,3-N-acetylglucosaminyltransferase